MEPILISVNDAAQILNLGRTSIYSLINAGRLTTVKVGRRTLVRMDSVRKLAAGED